MAISTLDGYLASSKQKIQYCKTASRTAVATAWFSLFDLAGAPVAGTLAGTDAVAGVVPTDAVAGYPTINTFGASATGYISKIEFGNTVPCRVALFDRIFVAGAFSFNAAATLASQPSYASRLPNADYNGLEIWIEQVTAATGGLTVNVGYTNQSGATGRATGITSTGSAPTVGRCWQMPLQTGDSGVQQITTVTGGVATAGTFNVMVLRPLWSGRISIVNGTDIHEFLRTGLPVIYDSSALYVMACPDSTATGVPEMFIEVANA